MLAVCRRHVSAVVAYCLVAVAFAWPLPLHMATHLTGSPEGDTGVYVWNQWVFRHELLGHQANPYFTETIFGSTNRANLTLHNYTTLANLLALPLIGVFGIVAAFNAIYLLMTVLTAYAMFLLVRATNAGHDGEAWLAGVVFAWSPMLVTRGDGHFSLVAAAPLPLFVLLLIRANRTRRLRDAAWVGLMLAAAFFADVYYAVYCVMLATGFVAWRIVQVERRPVVPEDRPARWWALDVMILCVAALVVAILTSGGWVITVFQQPVSMRELYTPVLALTILILIRMARPYRATIAAISRSELVESARLTVCAGLVAAIVLSPVLYGIAVRFVEGTFVTPEIHWRSSPAGVGIFQIVLPNPNHPLAPGAWRAWLSARTDGYLESVAAIPWSAFFVLCVAWARGWRPPRTWMVALAGFTLLALGPFVHVAGSNTYVPGPWAFLRYVPVVGLARNPARFAVVVMMALAFLFAVATSFLGRTQPEHPARRPWHLWGLGVLLVLELLPIPRSLHSARVPAIYHQIAADPRDVRVLELPFGVRDGTFSVGNYTARTQYFQTVHEKAVLGGVLSRVSKRRVRDIRRDPVLAAFIELSEGRTLPPGTHERLAAEAHAFMTRANLGYVVIDSARASDALVRFAVSTLELQALGSDGPFVLYRPKSSLASR